MWIKIRDLIRSVTKSSDGCDEKYMEVKFNSDDELPQNKAIETTGIVIVDRAVFHENYKYTLFLYKQSIFDPRPENCLNFSKKLPQKIV